MMSLPGHHVRPGTSPRPRNQRQNRQQVRAQHQPLQDTNQPEQSPHQLAVRDIRSGKEPDKSHDNGTRMTRIQRICADWKPFVLKSAKISSDQI